MLVGHLQQPGRRGARVVDDELRLDSAGQALARLVERLVGRLREVGLVLGVDARDAGRPRLRDDRAHDEVLARRARQHGGQVQRPRAAPVGGEADGDGHGVISLPASARRSAEWRIP